MRITQNSNGTEGAKHPSKQNSTGIQTPDNGSQQQSLYIAAMAQYVGCEGLASPATDTREGVEYTFDFYHPECGQAFKLLKNGDLSEYDRYTQYPGDAFVIVDVDGHPGVQVAGCECCSHTYVILPRELGEELHDTGRTLLYHQHQLCEYVRDAKDGRPHWVILEPMALRNLGNEDDGEESGCGEDEDDED